jgi:hypothetical protein
MAAGQQPRLGAELRQQRQSVLDAGRSLVLKRCRYLQGSSPLDGTFALLSCGFNLT